MTFSTLLFLIFAFKKRVLSDVLMVQKTRHTIRHITHQSSTQICPTSTICENINPGMNSSSVGVTQMVTPISIPGLTMAAFILVEGDMAGCEPPERQQGHGLSKFSRHYGFKRVSIGLAISHVISISSIGHCVMGVKPSS